MSQFLDAKGKLRFVILPPLLLQETSRRILSVDTTYVEQILPAFYHHLTILNEQLYNLEIDGTKHSEYL